MICYRVYFGVDMSEVMLSSTLMVSSVKNNNKAKGTNVKWSLSHAETNKKWANPISISRLNSKSWQIIWPKRQESLQKELFLPRREESFLFYESCSSFSLLNSLWIKTHTKPVFICLNCYHPRWRKYKLNRKRKDIKATNLFSLCF